MNLEEYHQMYKLEDRHWYFVGKRRLIRSILEKYLVQGKTYRILDVGCGTGKIMEMLGGFGDVSGADASITALEYCKARGLRNLYHLTAEMDLPFSDDAFELITALDVLEHVDEEERLIREIHRVCNSKGKLLITVPAFMFLWSPHDDALQHRRRYTRRRLQEVVESGGFSVQKISYSNFFLFPVALAIRWFRRACYGQRGSSEFFIHIPAPINRLLLFALRLEAFIIPRTSLPFGVSIVCLAEKSA